MKNILFTILLLFIFQSCFSQIDVMLNIGEKEFTKPESYDSSFNYSTFRNTLKLTGQTIFFLPHSKKFIEEEYKKQVARNYKIDTIDYSDLFYTKYQTTIVKKLTTKQEQANHVVDSIFLADEMAKKKSGSFLNKKNPTLSIEDYPQLKKLHPYDTKSIYTNVYKPIFKDEFNLSTPSKSFEGKYYKVKGVFKQYQNGLDCTFLDLVSKDDPNDTLIFRISEGGFDNKILKQESAPFIVQGYYEKEKNKVVGKKFYLRQPINKLFDLVTGKVISIEPTNEEWICSSLTFVQTQSMPHLQLCMILGQKTNTIALNLTNGMAMIGDIPETIGINNFKSEFDVLQEKLKKEEIEKQKKEEIERIATDQKIAEIERLKFQSEMIKKYGTKIGNLISNNKVIIGMSKEQCKLSWGEPSDINTTTTKNIVFEQWVYSMSSYLYFENNTLVSIQN